MVRPRESSKVSAGTIQAGQIVHDQTRNGLDRDVLHLLLVTERDASRFQCCHQMIGVQIKLVAIQDRNFRRWQLLGLYPAFNQVCEVISLLTTVFEAPREHLTLVASKLLLGHDGCRVELANDLVLQTQQPRL